MGRFRMSPGQRILYWLASSVGRPLAWVYRRLFSGMVRRSAARQNDEFVAEVEGAFHRSFPDASVVVTSPVQFIPAFDYTLAIAESRDRRFRFVRGRYEFSVALIAAPQTALEVFSTSMPTSSGRNGGDGGALEDSIRFLREYWDRFVDADIDQLRAMTEEMRTRDA